MEATIDLQDNTTEPGKPSTQNVPLSLPESSSSDSDPKTMDKHSPKVCNQTASLKEVTVEVQLPEQSGSDGTGPAPNPNADNHEDTFEVDPVLDASPEEDPSKSVGAIFDGSADSINHQNLIAVTSKANKFNLDETLDLQMESLVTSTPIVRCKVLTVIPPREEDRNPGAQKKLLGEDSVKPAALAAHDVPPNLICNRKTFLKEQTNFTKPRMPPPKFASEMLKKRAASALPGRFQLVTSSLLMTRQRTQIETSRNATASDAPKGTTGITSSYNLRATTTGLKLPVSGLRRPQQSGLPSGIQKIGSGLKMPSARSNAQAPVKLCAPAAAPSSAAGSSTAGRARALKPPVSSQRAVTDKPQAHAVHPAPKTLQSKKHLLPRNEAVRSSKRPKMDVVSSCTPESSASCQRDGHNARTDDAAVPSSAASSSSSSSACDASSRVRALKPPAKSQQAMTAKPQTQGCATCMLLEKQNKEMAEEIKRLNEELLKYKQENEDKTEQS
ncbi:unnamed protein product [Ophioblennius macclurei]